MALTLPNARPCILTELFVGSENSGAAAPKGEAKARKQRFLSRLIDDFSRPEQRLVQQAC
ncbi:hypothetical protein JHU04_001202 [Brenneria sp. 4F2]|nr:hypothetical protein [Brenneria bubanii]